MNNVTRAEAYLVRYHLFAHAKTKLRLNSLLLFTMWMSTFPRQLWSLKGVNSLHNSLKMLFDCSTGNFRYDCRNEWLIARQIRQFFGCAEQNKMKKKNEKTKRANEKRIDECLIWRNVCGGASLTFSAFGMSSNTMVSCSMTWSKWRNFSLPTLSFLM